MRYKVMSELVVEAETHGAALEEAHAIWGRNGYDELLAGKSRAVIEPA